MAKGKIKLSELKPNEDNPRFIDQNKLDDLKRSIEEFPKMMELRPIITDENNIVLGGNMRLESLKKLGYKEIPENWVKKESELSEDQKKEFIIKDNVGFGEWDWVLLRDWDDEKLLNWGLELPIDNQIDELEDRETIELSQSVQLEPPKEYILIMADPNSVEWEEMKETLKLKMVRRGGYKKGSSFDAVSLERVLMWNDFKNRLDVDSDSK